ncbi:MAG: hypothetical protein E7367_04480 [Clostridiales bacterium]|nr:hypothetical protein [Clostridiales bacterium]
MKKLFTMFMALCMCLGFGFAATACEDPAGSTPDVSTPEESTPTQGNTVTDEEWNAAIADTSFTNVTFTQATTGTTSMGETSFEVVQNVTIQITEEALLITGKATANGFDQDVNEYMTGEQKTVQQGFYIKMFTAILEERESFVFDESQGAYTMPETITVSYQFQKQNVTEQVSNGKAMFDANGILMSFAADIVEEVQTGVVSNANVVWTFYDYGTTEITQAEIDDETPDQPSPDQPNPDQPTPPAGDGAITEEEWNAAISDANFDNVTFFCEGTFDDGEEFVCSAAIAGDKALLDGAPLDAEFIPMLKSVYINTALAIVSNFNDFAYNADQNVFVGKGDITYTVDASAMGYENVSITVKNVVVSLDANDYIATIACEMTQSFMEDGEPAQLVMDVTFTYSNYGTTVIE